MKQQQRSEAAMSPGQAAAYIPRLDLRTDAHADSPTHMQTGIISSSCSCECQEAGQNATPHLQHTKSTHSPLSNLSHAPTSLPSHPTLPTPYREESEDALTAALEASVVLGTSALATAWQLQLPALLANLALLLAFCRSLLWPR